MAQHRPQGRLQDHVPQRQDLRRHGSDGDDALLRQPERGIAADFTPEQRRNVTIRKEILWELLDATGREARDIEVRMIRELRSNDPEVGYNRSPNLQTLRSDRG